MTTTSIPPMPSEPPTAGLPDTTVYTPTPIGGADPAVPSLDEAAERFWAPAGRLLNDWWLKSGPEQVSTIASQVTQQVHTLLTETETQRAAREQIAYEDLVASQRAMRDAQFAALGETAEQRTERHRVEKVLAAGQRPYRDDLVHFVDMLGDRINETPDERAARKATELAIDKKRRRAAEDQRLAAAGETPELRSKRHRAQAVADKREAKQRSRQAARKAARATGPSDKVRRFRRWMLLTAISAYLGHACYLVQTAALGGPYVGLLLALFGFALDLKVRGHGLRVTEVRGFGPLLLLIIMRIPVASGLLVAVGADRLLAALPI